MADTRQFPVTPAKIASLEALLAQHGLTADLTELGEEKTGGWDISWSLGPWTTSNEGSNATLTITLVKHPFLEGDAFWSKAEAALA